MDIKKLTRGDAIIALAALLIFVFSFLAYFQGDNKTIPDSYDVNAWGGDLAPVASALVITPILAAVLFVVGGLMPRPPQFAGLTLRQWAVPLAVITPLNALWSLAGKDGLEIAVGGIFLVLLSFILAGAVIGTEMLPALKAPLGLGGAGGGAPQGAAPYGAQPGYAGAPQGGSPYDSGPGQFGAQPVPGGAPAPAPAGAEFQPYWFSVPDQRPLVDATTNAPAGSLNPGVWYLAVAQHGQGLLVEVDGVRGVLWNISGIQKS